MSDEHQVEGEYGGRGLPVDYEPYENEIPSHKYAWLSLLTEGEFQCFGTPDVAPKMNDDTACFVFDHPDYEGGVMVPIRLGELTVRRGAHKGDGKWAMEEEVGVFDDLPDWVTHKPPEGDDV